MGIDIVSVSASVTVNDISIVIVSGVVVGCGGVVLLLALSLWSMYC